MFYYKNLSFLISISIGILSLTNLVSQNTFKSNSNTLANNDIIGYSYNLWAMQATSLCEEDTYRFTGRIFLDKRKSYKSSYDKKEHTFMYQYEFKNGGIHYFRGNQEFTKVVKHHDIKNYYIALKFDRDWFHHTYEDIIKSQNVKLSNELGCSTCNFSSVIYNKEKTWKFTISYEIRPIFKNDKNPGSRNTEIEKETVNHNSESNQQTKKIEKGDEEIVNEKIETKEIKSGNLENPVQQKEQVNNTTNTIINSNSISYHVLFKVLKTPDEEFAQLKDIGPIYKETFEESGTTRYLIGNETSYKEIVKVANQIKELGFKECKIAKYKNGGLKSYLNLK